ncbi:MAG: 3,4-dihydroxy-2-butanone-4-phosphate synthase [Halobacteriota archaeon]
MQETDYETGTVGSFDSSSPLDRAIDAFRAGQPVLIHDFEDREGETDIVYPAGAVEPTDVVRLRTDAGGLICVAVSDPVADAFGLPFLEDEIDHPSASSHDLAYDSRSSFSLPVNHRETYTGITDVDRSLTITELAAAATRAAADASRYTPETFAESFRSPGHVHVLRGAPNLLSDRTGHTELGLALASAAGLPPAVVVCEMLDGATGVAKTPADARSYAEANDLVYVEGQTVVDRLE